MTFRASLRAGTGSYHNRVDDLFGRFDLSDAIDYGMFLSAHARVLPAVELVLERDGIGTILPDWPARCRREALFSDMETLGSTRPQALDVPAFDGADRLWGAAYVLEGSKMGGALLARSVAPGLPSSYLGSQGPKGSMRLFMDMLDTHVCANLDDAIGAAASVFELFEKAGKAELELRVS